MSDRARAHATAGPGGGVRLCVVVLALSVLGLSACQQDVVCNAGGASARPAALTNGVEHAAYLGLEPWEEAAVVRITVDEGEGAVPAVCSGVLVDPSHVLTARHCLAARAEQLTVEVFVAADVVATRPLRALGHGTLDIAVLELDASFETLPIGTIPWLDALPDGVTVGASVQLAGFGLDEHGAAGARRFDVEQVSDLEAEHIVVSADGRAGACGGDSGGPLLVRGDDGEVAVVGLLDHGTASCYGFERYSRLDLAAPWLTAQLGRPLRSLPQGAQHAALGTRGRCFGASAVWVEAGALAAERCEGPERCGWDRGQDGYRCVRAEADACFGLTEVGRCHGGTLLRCVDGVATDSPCAACGFTCARSPRSGAFACLAP